MKFCFSQTNLVGHICPLFILGERTLVLIDVNAHVCAFSTVRCLSTTVVVDASFIFIRQSRRCARGSSLRRLRGAGVAFALPRPPSRSRISLFYRSLPWLAVVRPYAVMAAPPTLLRRLLALAPFAFSGSCLGGYRERPWVPSRADPGSV